MKRLAARHAACAAALFSLLAGSASAQIGFRGSLGFATGIPTGEFDEQQKDSAFGVGGMFGVALPWPVVIGADLTYLTFGSETRHEPFSSTIPDVTVEVERSNNLLQGYLLARLEATRTGFFRPYLEGLFGFNYLFTETTIRDEHGDEEIASSTNFDDTVLSYGGGGGFQIRIHEQPTKQGRPYQILLDLGARYLAGGDAHYLKRGSVVIDDEDHVSYTVSESTTDVVSIQLEVAFSY